MPEDELDDAVCPVYLVLLGWRVAQMYRGVSREENTGRTRRRRKGKMPQFVEF